MLTDCMVRFSQRDVFDDQQDLRPAVANFGTRDEILTFMAVDPILSQHPVELRVKVADFVLNTPGREKELIHQAQSALTVPEHFGVFCLCGNAYSQRMWAEYAGGGKGFIVAFNTRHPAFEALRSPGLIGEVEYGDEPIHSFLSTYGASSVFKKREQYRFEAEWRSVRALSRLNIVNKSDGALPIYLASFTPTCVKEILILAERSLVEWELRTLAAIDVRYKHVAVRQINPDELNKP